MGVTPLTEWKWIEAFRRQFELCALRPGETAVLLSETASRPQLVETSRLALAAAGARVSQVVMPTPANPGPVPIRSTGASVALQGHRAAVAALAAADFVVDCTVEGLLHAPELEAILAGGPRVLMISNEHPEHFERLASQPELKPEVERAKARLEDATVMEVTSRAGTHLTVVLEGAFTVGSWGWTATPGEIAHWPGGLVAAFPAAGTVDGTVVLAPGDLNLTFKEVVRSAVRLTLAGDRITAVGGDGPDAALFRAYLDAFDEPDVDAVSHVGWGLNRAARWESLLLWDKSQLNGTEARVIAGSFLFSTGANETAGRFCRGHFDLPLRGCTVRLDGEPVVVEGELV